MTYNMSEKMRKMRKLCAGAVHHLLCMDYDGKYTVSANGVKVYFSAEGVDITFGNLYSGTDFTVTIPATSNFGAIVTMIEGLLAATGSRPATSTTDTCAFCNRHNGATRRDETERLTSGVTR